ncbi:putative LPS assembly protein LptD [Blattabacterium cuenoti]|uniref:putative LPS assembly protein LptD n=1 Tax=Blattabacterium cuenoti TaxID=1653831 RepID=UPI00163BB705|nr:putative LPS assembly protein LptD [Blattabacterium cuenoti]
MFFFSDSIFVNANNEKKENKDFFEKKNNSVFESIIKYKSDIQEYNIKDGKSYLKGDASIKYDDIKIQADFIEFNWKNGDLYAIQKEKCAFLQKKNQKYYFNNLHINLKSKKIEAKDFFIKRINYMITADSIEKNDQNMSLMKKIRYTSDPFFLENKDNDPDFYLKTNFLKYHHIKKYIFSGPVFFYLYKVPMPIFLPFLYLPVKENKYGIIYPKIGIQNKKVYLEDVGLFFPIFKFLNFRILSSIYNSDNWRFKTRMEYKLKHSYNGFFDINYKFISKQKLNYQFQWEHNQDYKSDYDTNFNAKINYNNIEKSDNEFLSYLSVRKKFSNFLLFMDAYMFQQNSNNNQVGTKFVIPEFIFHMKNMPFSNKKNFFLRFLSIENKISIYNFVDCFHKYKKVSLNTGFNQKMSISTYFSFFDSYLKISPKILYDEFYTWEFHQFSVLNFREIDFSTDVISIPFYFNKILGIKRNSIFLSHKIEPVLSFYIRYFPDTFYNKKNHSEKRMDFILNNDFYLKIKNVFDKKLKIINNFRSSFIVNNNSMKWDNFHVEGYTDWIEGLGVKYKGGINSVKKNENMNKTTYFDFSFFCSYETNLASVKNGYNKKRGKIRYDYFLFDKNNYANYPIPFSFNIDYHSSYENYVNQEKSFKTFLSISGSVNITKYWKININTNYDLLKKKIILANIIFYRDLRSFEMSFNWVPLETPSWNFFIGIKDPYLRNIIQYNEKN